VQVNDTPAVGGLLVDVALPPLRCERLAVGELAREAPFEDRSGRIAIHLNVDVGGAEVAFEKRFLQEVDVEIPVDASATSAVFTDCK
jgi:hypothetical protein